MAELLIGGLVGFVAGVVAFGLATKNAADRERILEAENRAARVALRRIREGRAGIGRDLLAYIDRVLSDEAGA